MYNFFWLGAVLDPRKRSLMQEAIDVAWRSSDPETVAFQNRMFPEGEPSVTLFVWRMKCYALEQTFGRG